MSPRSVADATRFTATGPHALARPPDVPGVLTTPQETPQERVARLREAARKAKAEKFAGSTFDRLVDRGRAWADKAHRITALGLIGATILCGGVTIYAFTDMVIYNRRRKAQYTEQLKQQQKESQVLSAITSENGTMSSSIVAVETPISAEGKRGPWEKLQSWAMSGMTPADQTYKTRFEKEEEKRKEAVALESPNVVEPNRAGIGKGNRIDRLGADDLATANQSKGSSTSILSSITGWWSGR